MMSATVHGSDDAQHGLTPGAQSFNNRSAISSAR
jgi:hypothetical protein